MLPRPARSRTSATIARTDIGTQYFVNYVDQLAHVVGQLHRGRGARRWPAGLHDARLRHAGRRGRRGAVDARGATPTRRRRWSRSTRRARSAPCTAAATTTRSAGEPGHRRRRLGSPAGSTFKAFAVAEALQPGHRAGETYNSPAQGPSPRATPARTGSRTTTTMRPTARSTWSRRRPARSTPTSLSCVDGHRPGQPGVAGHPDGRREHVDPRAVARARHHAVSPLDMAAGYSTFMNEGEQVDPVVVTRVDRLERSGALRLRRQAHGRARARTSPTRSSWDLSGVIPAAPAPTPSSASPPPARRARTQDHRDAWFAGYTCSITAVVWMGIVARDDDHAGQVHGATLRSPIWRKFMAAGHQAARELPAPSPRPDDVSRGGWRHHQRRHRHRHGSGRRPPPTTSGRRPPPTSVPSSTRHHHNVGADHHRRRHRPRSTEHTASPALQTRARGDRGRAGQLDRARAGSGCGRRSTISTVDLVDLPGVSSRSGVM